MSGVREEALPGEPAGTATAELRAPRTVTLWHPESPGVRVTVCPCLLRRLRIIRSEFATLGEVVRMYASLDSQTNV